MTNNKTLILARTLPMRGGQGGAMRVGNLVQAACEDAAVTLAFMADEPQMLASPELAHWQSLCRQIIPCPVEHGAPAPLTAGRLLGRLLSENPTSIGLWPLDAIAARLAVLRDTEFDTVIVSRLSLMPVWRMLRDRLGVRARRAVLDLDDIESVSHARQTRVAGARSLGKLYYAAAWAEWLKLRRAEARAFRAMDRVLICSDGDRELLARRFGGERVRVVPNTIRIPAQLPPKRRDGPLQLLFVGSLDYRPNDDAVRWLADAIVPLVRGALPDAALRVVGRNAPAWMLERARRGHFEVHADVPDVQPYYAEADVVVAPIRSGGGTRIKILEAFGYGRAIVSTTLGAEGIEAAHERELLLADGAEAFAAALVRLAGDPALGARLVAQARELVLRHYSYAACVTALRQAVGDGGQAAARQEEALLERPAP